MTKKLAGQLNYADDQQTAKFAFKLIDVDHHAENINVMKKLRLLEVYKEGNDTKFKFDERLIADRYTYATNKGEHMIPVNPRLAVVTKTSSNIQICEYYCSSRYLAKCAAGIDTNEIFQIKATQHENKVVTEFEEVRNSKIVTKKHFQESKDNGRKDAKTVNGRKYSIIEQVTNLLNENIVHHSDQFVRIPTAPLEGGN